MPPAPIEGPPEEPPKASDASDYREAIEFLEKLRSPPWVLTAICPDGKITTTTTSDARTARTFIHKWVGERNLYYSVNPTRTAQTKKASKTDIAAIEFALADLDPNEGESSEDAKARYIAALDTFKPTPTAIVDSGNGVQVLWRLKRPITLAEPITVSDAKVFPPETQAIIDDAEGRIAELMRQLGSVAGTQNIDRILRVPGTINVPNKTKISKGRVRCPTKLIRFTTSASCELEDFPAPQVKDGDTKAKPDQANTDGASTANPEQKLDWSKVAGHADWLKTVADLPIDFNAKGKILVAHSGNIKDLNIDLAQAGLVEKPYTSWSDVSIALAAIFKADGRYPPEQIVAALMCELPCNRHVTKQAGAHKRRAAMRAFNHSHGPTATRVGRTLNWRECRANGTPLPSMHNGRLAIAALGIECSHDTFHSKILFGFKGDDIRHEIRSILGEVTDYGIIRLRQIISDRFGFDLEDKATRDAVKSLALEHCFDPVRDMLDEAEKNYDGVPRLDRMAVDYLNCDDTPFNRAAMRKTMIAAVRRARWPGVKYDTITVLESKEGWNKSAAWREIAGEENFSDERIIGKNSREVQEQLSEVWIHESADLAGMRKAEVETVKAFASRTTDIARAAFGHFVTKQKRHSIEVGTTNNDEYLQSQTGNRRFWPLTVRRAIDITLLRKDRIQLLGEAAKYESVGESITLDEKLWPAAGVEQEKRRTKDPWEDTVADIPLEVDLGNEPKQIIHEVEDQQRVSSSDILTFVLRIPIAQQESRHSMRLATVMKFAGWGRTSNGKVTINGRQVRGYFRWLDGRLPFS